MKTFFSIAIILTCVCCINASGQIQFGIHAKTNYPLATIQRSGTAIDTSKYNASLKKRPYVTFEAGVTAKYKLYKNVRLEAQVNIGYTGLLYRYTDADRKTISKGSAILFYINTPLHAVLTFPSNSYTSAKYIGIGPSVYYHFSGREKTKVIDGIYNRKSMSFDGNDNFLRSRVGMDAFVGFEDSENTSVRLGAVYDMQGIYATSNTKVFLHQVYLQLIKYF